MDLSRFAFLSIFIFITLIHALLLHSYLIKTDSISKPDTQVRHITLSHVVIKKPQPPKIDIPKIIPPVIQKPIIKPLPKPRPKPIHKRKRHIKKREIIKKPLKHEIVLPQPTPKIETKAPIKQIDTTSIKDKYTSEIRRQIKQHLFYPKIAKRMHIQDTVQVAFRVEKDGKISHVHIINHPRKVLSRGAIKTLNSLDLAPVPKELDQTYLDITIPIEFKLTQG